MERAKLNGRDVDILLVVPHLWEGRTEYPPNYFPLGIGYIASWLQKEDYNVEVLDLFATNYSRDYVQNKLKETKYDVIGIGGHVTAYGYAKWFSNMVKKYNPDAKIIAGGLLSTSIPKLLIEKTKVDAGVMGEGEYAVVELLEAFQNGSDLGKIKGIAYKEKGKVIATEDRGRLENLDVLPFPAWDLFPVDTYLKHPVRMSGKRKSLNMITTRGCPNLCIYCHRNFGRVVRMRSAENVIAEVNELKNKYGVEYILFNDELFTVNKERVMNICQAMIDNDIGVGWGCYARVNNLDNEMLAKMKEAGCEDVSFGVESGSQEILKIMKKGITPEQSKKAIELCRNNNIKPNATLMVGMFGETKKTIQETVNLCRDADIYAKLYYATPFPHTEMYEMAKKKGLIKDDEKYIEQLADVTDLLLNLTDLPDEELIRLKENAEKAINSAYFSKHKLELLKNVINFYRTEGLKNTLKMVKKGVSTMVRRKNEPVQTDF